MLLGSGVGLSFPACGCRSSAGITFWGSQKNLPCSQGESPRAWKQPHSQLYCLCPFVPPPENGQCPPKNPTFELAGWALENDVPYTKNAPALTSHPWLLLRWVGGGAEPCCAKHRDDPFPKELTTKHNTEKNPIIGRLKAICQGSRSC